MPSWAKVRRTRSGTICRIPWLKQPVALALKEPALSPRELAVSFSSTSSATLSRNHRSIGS